MKLRILVLVMLAFETALIAAALQKDLNSKQNRFSVSATLSKNTLGCSPDWSLLKANLSKINHHGKRADAIVKGMLQHSSSSGIKESTDINALADEYLRLFCPSLRAKVKTFIASLKTNAFYAVAEKKKTGIAGFEPMVSVTTQKTDNQILISDKDKGNGITKHILDKIFQPFFTTKPTGQGTGFGLSFSYDIVKTHGGELTMQTKENEGTEFLIILPMV